MKPHTPAGTGTTNSFDADHKANHCHAKRAVAACQASQKSFAEMLIVVDVAARAYQSSSTARDKSTGI